jgi:Fe-S-cluster containining protein
MLSDVPYFVWVVVVIIVILDAPLALRSIRLYSKRGVFRCLMCGNFCRFKSTNLTAADIKRLTGAGYADFYELRGEAYLKRVRGKCVFLKDDKCAVHEIRPQVCRQFPFFMMYGVGYAQSSSFCPAMDEIKKWKT